VPFKGAGASATVDNAVDLPFFLTPIETTSPTVSLQSAVTYPFRTE